MILFDNKCGFVLGENPKAPNPYVTWQFNEQDGHRDFFWGHYHNEPDMAERDFHNRAEDYQRRYHVFEVEQAPDKETYKYYSTQRPIGIGTYPNSYFNRPVHMDLYFTRQEVTGEAFQAWGAITYAQPLTEREMQDYELRPSRENLDIRRQMDAQAQVVGKWEDAHHVPEQRRLTWFYPDFGSYVAKEYVTRSSSPPAPVGWSVKQRLRPTNRRKKNSRLPNSSRPPSGRPWSTRGRRPQKRKPPTGASVRRYVYGKTEGTGSGRSGNEAAVRRVWLPPAPGGGKAAGQGKGAVPPLSEPGARGTVSSSDCP